MGQSRINLSLLPPLDVVKQIPYETIVAETVADAQLENASPSDPAFRVVLAGAHRELLLRQYANDQARGLLLAFAVGAQLDHIGATYYKDVTGNAIVRIEGESDDDYRARLQESPESLSVAGPTGAYEYHAKSAHSSIKDVFVTSPEPVEVHVYLLTYDNGGVASQEIIEIVENRLELVRPLTDFVRVLSVKINSYSVTASLKIKIGPDPEVVRIVAQQELNKYLELKRVLGGRVVESGVHAALTVEGVEEVTLTNWVDIVCPSDTAPVVQSVIVTVGSIV